jgi:hypothetical protein
MHRTTNDVVADGEVVWFRPPDAEPKLRMRYERSARREQESPVSEESTKDTVKALAQGMVEDKNISKLNSLTCLCLPLCPDPLFGL